MKMKAQFTRKFLGQLFPARRDANFEKAHLKAYLKGHELFYFGKHPGGSPMAHKVKQQVIQTN